MPEQTKREQIEARLRAEFEEEICDLAQDQNWEAIEESLREEFEDKIGGMIEEALAEEDAP